MKNIIFIGTNFFAANILRKLIEKKIKIRSVITKNDKKIGRGQKIKSYPVKLVSKENNIMFYTTNHINDTNIKNIINKINPEIIILVEYGEKIDNDIIEIPKHGIINLHPSILPKFRGATPIQSAIINNENETGVSIIRINNIIDSGNILNISECKINKNETYTSLSKKLINIGYKSLINVINKIKANKLKVYVQNEKNVSYTRLIDNNIFHINCNSDALSINRTIRAFYGIKKFYIINREITIKIISTTVLRRISKDMLGKVVNITKHGIDINTKKYILRVKKIQLPGKNINTIKNILNSNKIYFRIGDIVK